MGLLSVILTTWVFAYVASENQDSVLDLFPEVDAMTKKISVLESSVSDYQERLDEVERKLSYSKAYFFGTYHDQGREVYIRQDHPIPFWGSVEPSGSYDGGLFTIPYSGVYVLTVTISTTSNYYASFFAEVQFGGSYWNILVNQEKRSQTLSWIRKVSAGSYVIVRRRSNCCDVLEEATLAIFRLY